MTMSKARWWIVLVGVLLPYAARLPRGFDWLAQYLELDFTGWLFFTGLNAVPWCALLLVSLLYRFPRSLLVPALPGYGFLAWAHFDMDVAADAQSGIVLMLIPIVALVPIAIGAIIGWVLDLIERKRAAAK